MQLTFPNGEHPPVPFEHGELSIGSRNDQRVSLPGSALAAHHASIIADRRGLWLRVPAGVPGVHLNARPVRRSALLRVGDMVCLGPLQILLGEDDAARIDRRIPPTPPLPLAEAQRLSASRVLLRAVSGSLFGRSYTLTEPRSIGRGATCDIRIDDPALAERHAQFELHGDRVVLRALDPAEGSVVNGVPVRDAVLAPGDQIVVDQYRFVLEAPGLPARGQDAGKRGPSVAHTQTIKAIRNSAVNTPYVAPMPEPEKPASPLDPGALWWLIAAAAVLAAAMTALLVYSPHMGAA
jgi:hypothetical protein